MHNCLTDPSEHFSKYEQDIQRWLDRWEIHPAAATMAVTAYQDVLDKAEFFAMKAEKREDFTGSATTGRSLQESIDLLSGLMAHLKAEGVRYMNEKAGRGVTA